MIIEMKGIDKAFSGNKVLKGVDFSLEAGEIHALMGENGAGKSTMVKILTGIYERDAGDIHVHGAAVHYKHPKEAEEAGIAVIHQELNILPELTVAENLFLGNEQTSWLGWLKTKEMNERAKTALENLGLKIPVTRKAGTLSVGQQQIIEIAKALETKAKVIIMDEPTAALTGREIDTLFETIRGLQEDGVSFIYISHRMEEIFELCQRITVLRDGTYIGTERVKDLTFDDVVKMMVGREIGERFPSNNAVPGKVKMEVKGFKKEGIFEDISFDVKEGEILGIAGLMGAGRSEVVEAIFGYRKEDSGTLLLDGKEVNISSPKDAIDQGLGFISEDRKSKGLVVDFTIAANLELTNLSSISSYGWISTKKQNQLYVSLVEKLGVRTSGPKQSAKSLSGGNQQKVVIAKWLTMQPRVLILDEPTRGVDVGAKKEIYNIMVELAQSGVAIVMISSELPEVIGMSSRVAVMYEGSLASILDKSELSEEKIMHFATGGDKHESK